jgi:16S rRNA (guanine966-N2)-methyltransferase
VRETLFNWLAPALPGAVVLDLFAGTGALGLEAVSRGAAQAVFVERDRTLVEALRGIAGQWPGGERMEVVCGEALAWLERDARRFDVVFLDPPFSAGLCEKSLRRLAEGGHLAGGARVYVEQAVRETPIDPGEDFEVLREKTLGDVRMTLLRSLAEPAL